MRHVAIALLVAAMLVGGCGGSGSGERVELLTGDLTCYLGGEHPATAQLVADAEYGTTFTGLPVVWPRGYTGRRAGNEVEVLDAAASVRATTGRVYYIAMAQLNPYAADRFPAAVGCPYPWDFGECGTTGAIAQYCEPVKP
jgi:hypothetical protein